MSARWHCMTCGLATVPTHGAAAAREVTLLATIHDQVHHRGAHTAVVVVSDADAVTVPAFPDAAHAVAG